MTDTLTASTVAADPACTCGHKESGHTDFGSCKDSDCDCEFFEEDEFQ